MVHLISILIIGLAIVAAVAGASYIYAMTSEHEPVRRDRSRPSTPVH